MTERELLDKWKVCREVFQLCKKEEDKAVAYVARCKTSVNDLEDQFKILVELRTALQQTVDKIDSVISDSRILKLKQASTRGMLFCEGFLDIVRSIINVVQVFVWKGPGQGTEDVRVLVVKVIIAVIAPVCTDGLCFETPWDL